MLRGDVYILDRQMAAPDVHKICWLFVKFFILKWLVRPRLWAF